MLTKTLFCNVECGIRPKSFSCVCEIQKWTKPKLFLMQSVNEHERLKDSQVVLHGACACMATRCLWSTNLAERISTEYAIVAVTLKFSTTNNFYQISDISTSATFLRFHVEIRLAFICFHAEKFEIFEKEKISCKCCWKIF